MATLTIQQDGTASTTGTQANPSVTTMAVLTSMATPTEPRILPTDYITGAHGGLLYNCAPREVVGEVVCADMGPFRRVYRAECQSPQPVLGVIAAKLQPTVCEVVTQGYVGGYSGLTPGVCYYLGPMGTLAPLPLDPSIGPYVHYVGVATAADTLCLGPSYPLLKRATYG